MKEYIGKMYGFFWPHFRTNMVNFYLKDGVFVVEEGEPEEYKYAERLKFKRKFGERFFGDSSFLIGVDDDFVYGILYEFMGKNESEIEKIVEKYRSQRDKRRTKIQAEKDRWEELREQFDGVVIGLDSSIDVYENGFSVRVLFCSDMTLVGKRKFLANNKKEFLKWVMLEISNSKKMIKRVGDVRFYKPVEIINLRIPEVEVKFEIKGDVA